MSIYSTERGVLKVIYILMPILLLTVSFAQAENGVDLASFSQVVNIPALFAGFIASIVSMIRKNHEWIDGLFMVTLATVVVGAAAGIVAFFLGFLTVLPFVEWGALGALIYGGLCGIGSIVGVSFLDLVFARIGKKLEEGKHEEEVRFEVVS